MLRVVQDFDLPEGTEGREVFGGGNLKCIGGKGMTKPRPRQVDVQSYPQILSLERQEGHVPVSKVKEGIPSVLFGFVF